MPAASVLPPASCALNPHESLFSFLISEIIVSGMLSRGSIVDCGAHKGGEACLYASLAPARTVHAIEPQGMHISTMTRQYGSYLPNLRPLKGGLGSRDRTASVHGAHSPSMLLNVHARPDANASSPHINIHKLDTLYRGRVGAWVGVKVKLTLALTLTLTSMIVARRPLLATSGQPISAATSPPCSEGDTAEI